MVLLLGARWTLLEQGVTVDRVDPQIALLRASGQLRQAVGTIEAGASEAVTSDVDNSCVSEEWSSHVRARMTTTDTPCALFLVLSAGFVPVFAGVMSCAQVAAAACDDHDAV